MSELSVATARAAVNKYDPLTNAWVPGDSGISRVDLYHNAAGLTYRIIAVDERTKEFVVNSAIEANVIFELASPVFAQWTDVFDSSYGLNFPTPNGAEAFAVAVQKAIDNLKSKKVIIKAAAAAPIDAPPPLRAAIDRSTTNSAQILPEINTNAPFKPSGASQTPPSGPPPPSDIAQPPPTDVPPLPSKSITLSREHSTVGETTTSDLQSLASATKASPVATGVRNEPPAQMANSAPNGTPSRQDIPAIRGDHSQRSLPQKPPGESVTSPRSPRGLHADPQMMNLPIASAPPPPSDVPAPPTLHRGASRENYVVETSTQPPKSTNSAPNNGSVEGTPTPLRTRELVPSKSTPNMAGKLVSSSSPIPPSHALHESSSSLGTGEKSTEARNGPPSRGNTPSRGVFTKGAPRSSPVPPGNRRALPTPSGARETLTRPVTQPREATSPLANPGAPSPAAPHKNVPHQASPTTASSRSGAMPSLPRSQSPGGSKASESSSTVFSDSSKHAGSLTAGLDATIHSDIDLARAPTMADLACFKQEIKEYIDQAKREILDAININK